MKAKGVIGKLLSRYLLFHLLGMAVFLVVVGLGIKYGLAWYTHHGEGIVVPDLKGLGYSKARLLLEEDGLVIMVSDSGFNKKMPADCILAQTPGSGMKVKRGHVVYVTVNSPLSPVFAIPDVVDNSSMREAEAKLKAIGFRLLPAQRVHGERDWVYGIVCRGRRVSNGDRIPIEHPLTLLVGSGTVSELDDYEYIDTEPVHTMPEEGGYDDFEEVGPSPTEQ